MDIFQSGAKEDRTPDPLLAKQVLSQLSYNPVYITMNKAVGLNGLEPTTSPLSGVRSNHLSYRPVFIECLNIIPTTYILVNNFFKKFYRKLKENLQWLKRKNSHVVESMRVSKFCLKYYKYGVQDKGNNPGNPYLENYHPEHFFFTCFFRICTACGNTRSIQQTEYKISKSGYCRDGSL